MNLIQFLGFASRATTDNHRGPSSYYLIIPAEQPVSVSIAVSVSVFVYLSSNLVSCISTRFLLGQMIQMKCSEPANRAIWYLVPGTWYLVSNISYPIGFQDSSEEFKKDYVEDSMDLDATSHGFRGPGNRGT